MRQYDTNEYSGRKAAGTAAMSAARRRAVAWLAAVCCLWTLFVGPSVASVVSVSLTRVAAARAAAPEAPEPEPAAKSCACLRCGAGGPGHAAGKSCCCAGGPVLAAEPDPDALCLRALCDLGAPDAALAGVSPCPPAVLPAPAPCAPAPALVSATMGAVAVAEAAPSAPLSHPEAPPRATLS